MSAPNLYCPQVDGKIINWRMDCLVAAGMPTLNARILATRRDIDHRDAIALLERGCPVHLVMEIVE